MPPTFIKSRDQARQVLRENIVHEFSSHAPTGDQPKKYERVRAACRDAALAIVEDAPSCLELTQALLSLRAAMMWANAAIACHGNDAPPLADQAAPQAESGR